MLLLENQYAYINNQGYILEICETKLEYPIITGYITQNIEPGKRLQEEDLEKLNTVIQILKTAKEKGIDKKISNIDIENEKDFLIEMENEKKLIHFGDSRNVNDKFIMLKAILEDNLGKKGEIFVKNLDRVYFSEDYSEVGV